MIPQSALGNEQVSKTLLQALQAIQRRLKRAGDQRIGGVQYNVYTGRANPRNLPAGDVNLWIMLGGIDPDPDAPFQSDGFYANWEIQVILKDQGVEKYGFDLTQGIMLFGGIVKVMTETEADVSLDESIETVSHTGTRHEIGPIADGDRDYSEWRIGFRAMHPLLQHVR